MIDDFCRTIIARADVHTFVETGTFQGETLAQVSRWFSDLWPEEFGRIEKLVEDGERGNNSWNGRIAWPVWEADIRAGRRRVISIDNNPEWVARARRRVCGENPNVLALEGSSEEVLARMSLRGFPSPFLFYLDAHWGEYWPLRDELRVVLELLSKFIVVFDDLLVPGQPHWGYDVHGGKACSWETVEDVFAAYGGNREPHLYYPHRSNRDNRGWGVVFVGYSREEEDVILAGLPMRRAEG